MTTEPQPLPCPFCGYEGPLDFQDGSTHRWGVASCAECGASAGETRREYPDGGEWHATAIEQWNIRTPQPIQSAPPAGREPLTDAEVRRWWERDNGLEDCNLCKLDDFMKAVRAVEARHGIKGKEAENADG